MLHEELLANERFRAFVRQVEAELAQLQSEAPSQAESLKAEQQLLKERCNGWLLSLADTKIAGRLRSSIQDQYDKALSRIDEIDAELNSQAARSRVQKEAVDPTRIADCLEQLNEILAGQNASATNLLLSQHIDGIFCDLGGKVVVRMCRLGALAGARDLLPRQFDRPLDGVGGDHQVYQATPRRRTKRNVGNTMDDDDVLEDAIEFATDPERFEGLGPEWFSEDVFFVPTRQSWAEAHAREVAEYRLTTKHSMALTAAHFSKTIPTIRAALKYAKSVHGLDAFGTSISMSTRSNWSREHAMEVAEFFCSDTATMKEAVEHFGKSQPTIKKALEFAEASQGTQFV